MIFLLIKKEVTLELRFEGWWIIKEEQGGLIVRNTNRTRRKKRKKWGGWAMASFQDSWSIKRIGIAGRCWWWVSRRWRAPWMEWKTAYFHCSCLFFLCVLVAQPCPTPCDPMDRSPPGSSIHGILQARTLEWVAIPFSISSFSSWKFCFKCPEFRG